MTDVAQLAADEMQGRDNGTAGGELAQAWIVERLESLELEPVGDGFRHPFAEGVNLLAQIPGDSSDEVLVLGAHYDHLGPAVCRPSADDAVCNGASDNATGVAIVLAIAEALTMLPHRHTVLLAFWDAEEDGLLGSTHYVANPSIPMERTRAALNVDIVGTSIFPGASSSFALGAEHATGLREVVQRHSTASVPVHAASLRFSGDEEGARSDHHPFRMAGVPVLFFSSGSPPEYHSVDDDLDTIEQDKFLAVARHTLLVTAELADAEERPGYLTSPAPSLDDARTLLDLAEDIRADPSFLGDGADALLPIIDGWTEELQADLDKPPSTEEEWQAHQERVRNIIDLVFLFAGR